MVNLPMTWFHALLSLLLVSVGTQGQATESSKCTDTGCESYYDGGAACVYVLHGNWTQIGLEYYLNTPNLDGLCRGTADVDCCRCFRTRIIEPTTTTTTTTTTSTTTTTTTTTTSTTSPVGCTDVDGHCRSAFNGSGLCIDVRQGDLADIDIYQQPLDGKCGAGSEKCCECFKMKTKDCNEEDAIHSSIGFAIDNTGSVSSSSVGVMALSRGLINNIVAQEYIIPRWVLVTFNDHPSMTSSSPPTEEDILLNTDLRIVTGNVDLFRSKLNDIAFNGGGDGPERATQGLWVTLNNLPRHGIALIFTDHQSKDLDMESALTELKDDKDIKIFVVLAPRYSGTVGDASWNLYNRLSDGRIYNMADFNATHFLKEVVQVVGETCEENIPPLILSSK